MTPLTPHLLGDSPDPSVWSRRGLLAATASTVALAGCASSPSLDDHRSDKPTLDLASYLNGPLLAHGLFTKRGGQVARRFVVDMTGRWSGPPGQRQGELDERFLYSDGQAERRVWRLQEHAGGRYTGRADDVVGEAEGQQAGNAFHWTYTLALPVDGRVIEVQFDDWMWLLDERVMLNRARMHKFGITLGEVLISFRRGPP